MTKPLCSVIMAAYNDEQHIYRSLLSIMHQTLHDIEIIVVDDASTDQTSAILQQLAVNDSRLQVIRNSKRMERAYSRNRAVETAQTSYIAIMDSDDVCMPDRLELQRKYLSEKPETVLVGGQIAFLSPENELFKGSFLPTDAESVKHELRRRNSIAHPTAMLRKEVFQKVGGYDLHMVFSEDYDLFWRISQYGALENLNEVTLLYNMDWSKEKQVHYRRRLNHLRVRLRWLLKNNFNFHDAQVALIYLLSAIAPSQITQKYRQRKYSQPVSPDFAEKANTWLQQLIYEEQKYRERLI